MRFSAKSFLDNSITDNELSKLNETFSRTPDSKMFSSSEEKDIRAQWLSFGTTLSFCSKGKMFSPDFKNVITEFEKVGYDIKSLPKKYSLGFSKTYEDLKSVNADGKYKGKAPDLYCKIYEFFSDSTVLKFLNRVKNDPINKNNKKSLEDFSVESLESMLITNGIDARSVEGIFSVGTSLAVVPSIKSAVLGATTTIANMNNMLNILMVLLIAVSILITVFIIIHIKYTAELNRVVIDLTEKDKIVDRKAAIVEALDAVETNTSPLTKNLMVRPALHTVDAVTKMAQKSYDFFDKTLKTIKNSKSKEELEENTLENNEDKSEEGAINNAVSGIMDSVAAKAAGAAVAVGTFVSANPVIFITAAVVATTVLLIIYIKPLIYYCYRLRLRVSQFFEDQAEMLEINYGNLETKLKDPRLSQSERDRITKVIEKQRSIAQKMSNISKSIYGETNSAAMDTRDDIRTEDKINYDQEIDKIDEYENKQREDETKKEMEIVSAPTPNKTTVIF